MEQLVPNPHDQNPDYVDSLPPGYRFCPTDLEILVYYLKPMLERREHPPLRFHEVNIYNHDPEELAERYRPCDDSWYFLTPVERKYTSGKRSNRITKNLGLWKASQSFSTVYDDVNEGGLAVGTKTGLAYFDDKKDKTQWLIHEYKIDNPNYPIKKDDKKVHDLVLCKMYKTIRKDNKRKQEERNQLDNESPSRRQRLSINQDDNVLQRQIKTKDDLQSSNMTSMKPTTTYHDLTILPQYVHNPHNNNEDIQAPMDFQSPIQSTTTHEDDFSCDDLRPLDFPGDQYNSVNIQAPMDFQSPIQSTTTHEDDFSSYNYLLPLDFPGDQYNNIEDIQAPLDFQSPIQSTGTHVDDFGFYNDLDPLNDPGNDLDLFSIEELIGLR